MNKVFALVLATIALMTTFLSANPKPKASKGQMISASFDQTGQHSGTAAISGPATVKCESASSDIPQPQPQPTCNITAPGYSGEVQVGHSIGASGAGTVVLNCDGQGNRLVCSASIH